MYSMEWRQLLIVAAVAVAVAKADGERFDRICDPKSVCKCNEAIITCECPKGGGDQTLSVNSNSIPDENKQRLTKFDVKDCHSLSFLEGAFKTAPKLQTVHVTNVTKVTFNSGIFSSLHTLLINNIEELHIKNGALVNELSSIVIEKSHIPILHSGALQNIPNLQEFKLSHVKINKIEKEAITFLKTPLAGTISIVGNKIFNIEEKGVELGSSGSMVIENNEIDKADSNSLRIGVIGSVSIKGNVFYRDVNVNAANIIHNKPIQFTNNTLLNVDILNAANLDKPSEHDPIYNLDRLVTLHGGNYVNCTCLNSGRQTTEELKQNICNYGCNDVTVTVFLKSCEKNNKQPPKEILTTLCDGVITTPNLPRRDLEDRNTAPHTEHGPTTVKPGHAGPTSKPNRGARENVVLAPLFAVYLFHRIL